MTIFRRGPHWLPIVTAIYLPLSFFITYGVAVAYKHVKPSGFPYISDTGTTPPESCLFGQFLAIGAVLTGLCVYIRFRHVMLYNKMVTLNKVALVVGCAASVGLSVVGNFQETSVHAVHIFGAFLAFIVGVVYMWIDIVIAIRLYPSISKREIVVVRVLLACLSSVFVALVIIGDIMAYLKHKNSSEDERHWRPGDDGYLVHVMSTVSEWLMAFTFCCYFLSFSPEFYRLKTKPMTVLIITPNHSSSDSSPEVSTPIIS